MRRIFVDLSSEMSFGLGDTISFLPAFRALRKKHPNDEIIVVGRFTGIPIYYYCDYIDYFLPVDILDTGDWGEGYNITMEERMDLYNPTHHHLNHHKDHFIKTNIRYLLLESPEGFPCEYELSIRDFDVKEIEDAKSVLLEKAAGKKIVGIAPSITMYSRMWPKQRWQELTNLLRENGYFVVSLGCKDDLPLDVDFDGLGLYPINQIPRIIDVFDAVFVIDSGMMHIAAINQDVHIVKINTGQFGAECYTPYRHGEFAHNFTIIDHNCPNVHECFLGNATNVAVNTQYEDYLKRWKMENFSSPPTQEEGMLQKYVCWNYCYRSVDKYLCNTISAVDVFNAFRDKKSMISQVESKPLPILHDRNKNPSVDFHKWKEAILVPGQDNIFVLVNSEYSSEELIAKMKITHKLYKDKLLIVICSKRHIPFLKNCKEVYFSIPVEYLITKVRIGRRDVFLTI